MNIGEVILASLPGIMVGIIPWILQARREKNLPKVDNATAGLSDAQRQKIQEDITNSILLRNKKEMEDLQTDIDTVSADLKTERHARRQLEIDLALEKEERAKERQLLGSTISTLQGDLKDLQEKIADFEAGVPILIKQIREKGDTPAWRPRGYRTDPLGKLPVS